MKIVSQKFRIAIVGLLIALPMFGATQVAAQEQEFTPEAYTSQLSGYEVEVAGPTYEITSAELEHYSNGEGEIVNIESAAGTVEVSFFDDEDTPEDSLDAYIAGMDQSDIEFEELDRGVNGDVTYSVILVHYDGIDVIYYMQVTEDVTGNVDLFETLLSRDDIFEDDFAAAQEEITIDGVPFMETVDVEDILAVVDGSGSGDDTTTPESATPENSVPFENANVDLEIAGEFEVEGEPVVDGTVEGHVLIADNVVAIVAVGETDLTAVDTVESFSDGLVDDYDRVDLVDSSDETESAWSLFELERDGEVRVLLVAADTQIVPGYETLVSVLMPQDHVAGSIQLVQDNLTVDGQPLLDTIDGEEMASLVADGDNGDTADVTPEATVDDGAEEGSETDNPREDAKLPVDGSDDEGSESNTSETNTSDTDADTTPEATEEPSGDTGDSSWQAPISGNDVSWDASVWLTDLENSDFVEVDEEAEYESLSLTADLSSVPTLMFVEFYDDSRTTQDFLDYWTSSDYLQRTTSSGSEWNGEILSSRSRDGNVGVVVSYSTSSGDYMLVREAVELSDGSVMVITLDADSGDFAAAFAAAHDGVSVNDEPILNVFTSGQIERLSGD